MTFGPLLWRNRGPFVTDYPAGRGPPGHQVPGRVGLEAQAPGEARLLTFGLTPTFAHYSRLQTHELWALTEADLAALLADAIPTFVLLDLHNVETQWQGRSPSLNYHWLQTGPGLETLAVYDAYTLFRVRCPCP